MASALGTGIGIGDSKNLKKWQTRGFLLAPTLSTRKKNF
jgi:hypothetical protein